MTAQDKTTLKTYFERGDRPTQSQFEDLIDSFRDIGTPVTANDISNAIITNQTYATAAAQDYVLITDTSDNNNLRRATVQDILNLVVAASGSNIASSDITGQVEATVAANDYFIFADSSNSDALAKDTVQGILDLAASNYGLNQSSVVSAGEYVSPNITINAKGIITSVANYPHSVSAGSYVSPTLTLDSRGRISAVTPLGVSVSAGTYSAPTLTLNANGQITAVSAGGSSSYLKLDTQSISGTTTCVISLSSAYTKYVIEVINLTPATDASSLVLQASVDGGATYLAVTNYRQGVENTTDSGGANNIDLLSGIGAGAALLGAGTGESLTGTLCLSNFAGSKYKQIIWDASLATEDTGAHYNASCTAQVQTTSAITNIKFTCSSNMTATFIIYGIL